MTRYVVVSSDGNPDYDFYLPLVSWAWERLGWQVVVLREEPFGPYRPQTIAQVSRLYAAVLRMFNDDDLLMTSDADMIPLSDYWHPDPSAITTYGHDLTDYEHVPICYIAMTARNWRDVMDLRGHDMRRAMERDLAGTNALSDTWPDWWLVDQEMITSRLRTRAVTSIVRGNEPGSYLAMGRLDRAEWRYPRTLVDLHAPKCGWEHWPRVVQAVTRAFGEFPENLVDHDRDFIGGLGAVGTPLGPSRQRADHPSPPVRRCGEDAPAPAGLRDHAPGARVRGPVVTDEAPKLAFTGLVVALNEAGRLADCLRSLRFCDELLVVDLGSTDETAAVAREAGAEVIPHARVAIAEMVWEEMFARARNDWIVVADPDEVMPPNLDGVLRATIAREPTAGLVYVPVQFYFRGRPVTRTFWGHVGVKRLTLNRRRLRTTGQVHHGVELLPGYEAAFARAGEGWYLRHYWVDSWGQLFEKHWRYLKLEGGSRYSQGERFSWRLLAWMVKDTLRRDLFAYGGLRGGPRDWFLSLFHTWYVGMSMLSLRRHERRLARGDGAPASD